MIILRFLWRHLTRDVNRCIRFGNRNLGPLIRQHPKAFFRCLTTHLIGLDLVSSKLLMLNHRPFWNRPILKRQIVCWHLELTVALLVTFIMIMGNWNVS